MDLKNFIDAAVGRKKADIVFRNGKIINVFTGEIIENTLAVKDGKILGYGAYEGVVEIDVKGAYLSPGFIDAHVHIESSLTTPEHFASLVVPRGTTTVVADPHEIANVAGLEGIRYMLDASEGLPLECLFMLPSCVPATPFENSGAKLSASDLVKLAGEPRVLGLGEMMDYPSLIEGDPAVLEKMQMALDRNMPIDGHAPMVDRKELNAYIGAGVGTDHECSTPEEMRSRLRRGMYVLIREGSAARNLKNLIHGVKLYNLRRCAFCTDDKQPEDILKDGHINYNIREAIDLGMDPVWAVQMATLNPAECYHLKGKGALAPGYDADIVILDDLKSIHVQQVYKKGVLVAEDEKALFSQPSRVTDAVVNTVKVRKIRAEDFSLPMETDVARVIRILPHSLVTENAVRKIERDENGLFKIHPDLDILKIAVIERHGGKGTIGLGLVENYRLKGGAIASSIGHDSHNLIVVGDRDEDMALAVNSLAASGGGISVVANGELVGLLPLPIGGLMSDKPAEEVSASLKDLLNTAVHTLGVNKEVDPFMTLAFMALPVIPELKLTDEGLFDVLKFEFVDLCIK
ncbi:adenine deaminase [Oceanispirochaeta crateris]|uniref:Adenine deaminase n=1 Tax=Oceanispirochaeta crateris TaxID=2518645 RepID=A0A5C1QQH2_9SPIO|nr:adenine deaminase [Oceanispirochaeta crateris]QEN08864.1 adenine deaminase [Oceanispirochaeta crateris]